jgi:hypothetical protein
MTFPSDVDRTPWALCCLLLPLIREEVSVGLGVAGAILSVLATFGATCGIGRLVGRSPDSVLR